MDKKNQNKIKKKDGEKTTMYRNPYFNFLQDFRKKNSGLSPTELTIRAAEVWRKMGDNEKAPYYEMARKAPKRRKRAASRRRRRRRRAQERDLSTSASSDNS